MFQFLLDDNPCALCAGLFTKTFHRYYFPSARFASLWPVFARVARCQIACKSGKGRAAESGKLAKRTMRRRFVRTTILFQAANSNSSGGPRQLASCCHSFHRYLVLSLIARRQCGWAARNRCFAAAVWLRPVAFSSPVLLSKPAQTFSFVVFVA